MPTDLGKWEVYSFGAVSRVPGEVSGAGGFDLNYGGARDLQLTATLPVEYSSEGKPGWSFGDIEIGAKYRFLHHEGPTGLDVAICPRRPAATARLGSACCCRSGPARTSVSGAYSAAAAI